MDTLCAIGLCELSATALPQCVNMLKPESRRSECLDGVISLITEDRPAVIFSECVSVVLTTETWLYANNVV